LVYDISYLIDDIRENYDSEKNISSVFFDRFIRLSKVFLKKEELPKGAIIVNKENPYNIGK
jgi:predicted secreted protein